MNSREANHESCARPTADVDPHLFPGLEDRNSRDGGGFHVSGLSGFDGYSMVSGWGSWPNLDPTSGILQDGLEILM